MNPDPRYGRTETPMHVFPVADLTLPGAGPQPGVVYGRTEVPVHMFPPTEVEFAVPSAAPGKASVAKQPRAKKRGGKKRGAKKPRIDYYEDGLDYALRHGKHFQLRKELTRAWIKDQWQKQNGRCYWTGIPLIRQITAPGQPERKDCRFVSIDRLDHEKGYTPDNCVLACRFVNLGRNDYSGDFEQFLRDLRAALNETYQGR